MQAQGDAIWIWRVWQAKVSNSCKLETHHHHHHHHYRHLIVP